MKYTVSQLAEELNTSIVTANKWMIQKGFKTVTKEINNREVKAYELTEQQLENLKHEKGIETPLRTLETPLETVYKMPEIQLNQNDIIQKVIDFSNDHIKDLKNSYERVMKAELSQKLIEDSERRKDDELHRLNAVIKELNITIETLKAENEKLKQKSFFGIKLK
jgi:hypothetical protein